MSPLQQKMMGTLRAPLVDDVDAANRRRTIAIQAPMAYCLEQEPLVTKILERNDPPAPEEITPLSSLIT